MLFQSPEGSATKPHYRIDSIFTGPGIENNARQGGERGQGMHVSDRDTHTKPGGLFLDVYVDLIPSEQAEAVCAFVSPTHPINPLTTHFNGNSNKDGTGNGTILNPSTFLSPVRTSTAGDIDCELRARLQVRYTFLFLFISHFFSYFSFLSFSYYRFVFL